MEINLTEIAKSVLKCNNGDELAVLDQAWERVTDAINSTRIVYFTDRGTVVKFPKSKAFKKCNKCEVKNWEHVNDETMLAPVVDYDDEYRWLEMVRCGRISYDTTSRKNRFYQKVNQWKYNLNDIHCQNIGWNPHNMELVSIDYASSAFWNQKLDNR